jgi:hypothetical protein
MESNRPENTRTANESLRSIEEYAWSYGFKPQEQRTRTTLDTHTSQNKEELS